MKTFLFTTEATEVTEKRRRAFLCGLCALSGESLFLRLRRCLHSMFPRASSWLRPSGFVAVLALVGFLAGCSAHAPSASVDFFPAGNSVPGWVKSSETRTFEASRLWEYIDGDADKYVQAGVLKTLTSDYRFSGKTDAAADVYVMGEAAGARKIYDSESAEGSQPITMGDAGRYAKGSLTFRQGPYFVRLVAYEDSPEIAKGLADLAHTLSDRLSKSGAGKP